MYYNINESNKIGFYPKLSLENTNRNIYISFYLKEIIMNIIGSKKINRLFMGLPIKW